MRFLRWSDYLSHSAKGSTWEKHKYVKRIDGTYYYPDSYEGGRHLPDGESDKSKEEILDEDKLYEKLKNSYDKDLDDLLRNNFDKVLRDQLGVDWAKLPKEEVDRMQRSLIDRLKNKDEMDDDSDYELSEKDIEALAKEVWNGNFGNGAQRKELLGEYYDQVQKKVNEISDSVTGNRKTSTATKEEMDVLDKAVEKASKKSSNGSKSKGIDMEQVFSVYRRKQQ